MNKIEQLQARQKEINTTLDSMLEAAMAESRDYTPDEETKEAALKDEFEANKKMLARIEEQRNRAAAYIKEVNRKQYLFFFSFHR